MNDDITSTFTGISNTNIELLTSRQGKIYIDPPSMWGGVA